MKSTFTLILIFAYFNLSFAQTPMITYVWEFETSHDEYLDQATWITESFENELLEHKELYVLVERNNLAEVKEHEKLNKKLGGEEALRVRVSEPQNLEPGAYFGGKLEYDDGSGEFRVSVNLTSVTGSAHKMRKAEIAIPKGLINDHNSRKQAIAKLFTKLHLEEQKEVSDNVSSWFDNYVFQAKELQNQMREMNSWLPLKSNKGGVSEYNKKVTLFAEKIMAYNGTIETLLNDRSMIISNFCLYWEGDACKQYGRLLDRIVGFHDRLFNDDSNDIIQLVNQYTGSTKGKEIKVLQEKILTAREEVLDDFSRDFTEVQYSIRDFEEELDEVLAAN